ncbi:hypothetical protein GH5_07822 [Leishmania sp. Ghana 2012 LV757]|uniref:hypothetical protein n=1 Tax=Leishmania sp. Ghana 2012 LV757 TaxID=2803181 RepID=UPI001B7207D6|nr:hypothetical protein GH5_07822 [Leishmania sp. Ghana 2012 LV757]
MSRVSIEGEGCDGHHGSGNRVYVNNMNTPYPTVSLPERTTCSLRERNTEEPRLTTDMYVGARVKPINALHHRPDTRRATGGLPPSALADSESTAAQQHGAAPLTVDGEAVHANLQDVYKRIMRRLQHQINYAELSRITLAEQYGVDVQLECERNQQDLKVAEHRRQHSTKRRSPPLPSTSTASSPIKRGPDGPDAGAVSGLASRFSKGFRVSTVTAKVPEHDPPRTRDDSPTAKNDGGSGGRGSSRLTQFKVTDHRSGAGGARAPVAAAEEDGELERDIAGQPCPLPLRLVIQHVLSTLRKKMSLAESGSLKDCIVFSFESRALLDRLLKEIPLYSQYSASRGTAAIGAAQQGIAQVYHELRKKPLFVPRADYVEDPVTGAIRGQIVGEGPARSEPARASGTSTSAAAVLLPAIVNVSRNFDTGGSGHLGAFTDGADALDDPQLPSGYGKSSRLNGATPQGETAVGCVGHAPQRRHVLRDHMSGDGAAGGGSPHSFNDVAATLESAAVAKETASSRNVLAEASVTPPSAFAAAHRATRLVSVGTVTEENYLTTVPKADYAALQQQMEMLEAQLADAHMHRSALADQLCEEAHYTEQKKRVLQYLRETLVRECTMLRSQLHLASGRVQQLQQQQHSQQQLLRGAALSSGVNDATNEGPNSSMFVFGATRTHKQHGPTTAPSMALSLSGDGHFKQHRSHSRRISGQRLSMSGSIGSACGGIYGGGHGRSTKMQSHANGASVPSGASLSAIPPGAGAPASGIPSFCVIGSTGVTSAVVDEPQPNDLEAVTSLLDLVLLAVEEDAKLPSHTLQVVRGGRADMEAVKFDFRKDAKQQIDGLRVTFDERQNALKKSMLMRTAEHKRLVAEQQLEVARLRALTDTTQVRAMLQQHVSDLRNELHQLRMHVAEQLHFFTAVLHNTSQSLLRRSAIVDKTLSENVVLSNLVNAMRCMVESAGALLMPMLTNEYRCGYHPWPLKLRNTTDPLAHIIHLRYGPSDVIRLRDSLSVFSQLYTALHQYIVHQIVLPDSTRPSAGKPLQHLCAALALNPMSHTEVVFAARHAYDAERQLIKQLARLNAKILWNAHLQRVYTNRSLAALVEAGLSPRQAALPVAGRINALAKERAALLQARVKVQRERAENAKVAYRLWQEKEIDITEGYPAPPAQRNRLALLNGGAAGGKSAGTVSFGSNARRGTMQGQLNSGAAGRLLTSFSGASIARSEGAGAVTT